MGVIPSSDWLWHYILVKRQITDCKMGSNWSRQHKPHNGCFCGMFTIQSRFYIMARVQKYRTPAIHYAPNMLFGLLQNLVWRTEYKVRTNIAHIWLCSASFPCSQMGHVMNARLFVCLLTEYWDSDWKIVSQPGFPFHPLCLCRFPHQTAKFRLERLLIEPQPDS